MKSVTIGKKNYSSTTAAIQHLLKTTKLSNSQIVSKLGTSPSLVSIANKKSDIRPKSSRGAKGETITHNGFEYTSRTQLAIDLLKNTTKTSSQIADIAGISKAAVSSANKRNSIREVRAYNKNK